jgi:hypothetical protein
VGEAEKAREAAIQLARLRKKSSEVVAQKEAATSTSDASEPSTGAASHPALPAPDVGQAAAKLLEAGLALLETIAPPAPNLVGPPDHLKAIERDISSLLRIDAQTQRPVLTVRLPESITAERVAGAISSLLSKLGGLS